MSLPKSIDWTEDRFEYRDEREPAALPGGARLSQLPWVSYRSSVGFSLCNLRPKNDLPADVCLDLSETDVVVGILTCVAEGGFKAQHEPAAADKKSRGLVSVVLSVQDTVGEAWHSTAMRWRWFDS
jgi:hypothetical protein